MMRRIAVALMAFMVFAMPATAKTLRIGLAEDPATFDPTTSRLLVDRIVLAAMCDKLFDISPKLEIVPQLATSYAWSSDNKALTLSLRSGVSFQDGEPFDAAAEKFSLKRHLTFPGTNRKGEIAAISSIDVVDDHTIRLNLSAPFAPLLSQLADRAGMMLAPKAAAAAGDKFGAKPVCVGPFKLKERVAQDRIVLERDPTYWDKAHIFLDEVVYRSLPDSSVRLANLQSGDLDMIERVAATDMPALRQIKSFDTASAPELGWTGIVINIANGTGAKTPLGQQALIRQAFELSLDRKAINEVVFNGDFIPGNQWVPPASPYYTESLPVPPRDVARAKRLLAELGQPHPTVDLIVLNNPELMRAGEVIQAMAKEAGFEVKLTAMETASALRAQDQGDFTAAMTFWSGRPDPDGNISIWAACKAALNTGHYCNGDLDRSLAEARQTIEPAERKRLYALATEILLRDRPYIWLFHRKWYWAYTAQLQGFTPYPDGLIRLQNVKLP
jgi:peptide/nickel transport system substrate-binding protein